MNLERAIGEQLPTRRRWHTWTNLEPVLAGRDLEQVRTELRHGPQCRQDELLAALVRIAQRDVDAVTVVVRCLLPGLRGLISRHAPGLDRSEAFAVAVGGLAEAIVRFDGELTFVASQLLRLPRYRLQRAVRIEGTWRVQVREVHECGRPMVEVRAAVCLGLAVHAGLLNAADAWLIHATRVVGHSLAWAAGRLGIGYEAAKKRRQRAEARFAGWWTADEGTPAAERAGRDERGRVA